MGTPEALRGHGRLWVVCIALGLLGAGCDSAADRSLDPVGTGDASDGSTTEDDASTAGDDDADASDPPADADPDDGSVQDDDARGPTEGRPCASDADCQDDLFCNGEERCVTNTDGAATCQAGERAPCTREHPCVEARKQCDCAEDRDSDGDMHDAEECGGDDCDDSRSDCFPGGQEWCDSAGSDEDCNPQTFNQRKGSVNLDGDEDRDGHVDQNCRNTDRKHENRVHRGDDCNDHHPRVHPRIQVEVCNYLDDNCDGYTDEIMRDGVKIDGGLMLSFYRDHDRDLRGDMNTPALRACDFTQPPGYIYVPEPTDCDDDNAARYTGSVEVCDGVDNDCDGLADADDKQAPGALSLRFSFPGTSVICEAGAEIIAPNGCPENTLWCPGDDISRGCARDGTRRSSCRRCGTNCKFACGATDCDDIDQLSLGADHACARTGGGLAACWGRGESGRLGNDSVSPLAVPDRVIGLADVKEVASGASHSCAIVGAERALYCWGSNSHGQLGNMDAGRSSALPVAVLGAGSNARLKDVSHVAAGAEHTCAVLGTGGLVCFGETSGGRLGNGVLTAGSSRPVMALRPTAAPPLPVLIPREVTNARLVTAGRGHSCIVTTDARVECWGTNENGQLARDGAYQTRGYLEAVTGLQGATAVAAGSAHTCAIASNVVQCWGNDSLLQLGRGPAPDTAQNWVPTPVTGLTEATAIASGALFNCATQKDGVSFCWGANVAGQLGPAATTDRSHQPVPLPSLGIRQLSAGTDYACALDAERQVVCWGYNFFGQLGRDTPSLAVPDPGPIRALKSSIP